MSRIKLIAGLGNPGPAYAQTRHNIGADYVRHLAVHLGVSLAPEARFKAELARVSVDGEDLRLLVPQTYMNLSGQAVGALASFFKLTAAEILVVYDEMVFEPGQVRLKVGGGANGHNGLRSIIESLANDAGFVRLRIGVGHPGDRSKVTPFLTSVRMPAQERERIEARFADVDAVLPFLVRGEINKAMNVLHANKSGDGEAAGDTL